MPPVTKTTTNTNLQAVQQQQQEKVLRMGAEGTAVRDLQKKLKDAGYNPGAADGQFGPKTDRAVRQFQQAKDLGVDGVVGSKTWGKLNNVSTATPGGPKTTPAPQTGTKLDCFPIVGKDGTTTNARYNIGYDKSWSNFNPDTASQNSDFSKSATNASHPTGHLGVDVFAPKGQPVVAPVSGTVVKAGYDRSGGNRVTIKRGNEYFYLAHLDQIAPGIRPGAKVGAGTKIGTVGDTGKAKGTAPHLHFSIYRSNNYNNTVNPFSSLAAAHQSARAHASDYF